MAPNGFSLTFDHKRIFNITMLPRSLVVSWWQRRRENLNLENESFYLVSSVAQMNCVVLLRSCWITASVCAMEMSGMPWLILHALNQTVPSLWEWLLIKEAWTHWIHATIASGCTYIFIVPLPNLIKIGDKQCTEQTISMTQTGFAPLFIAYPFNFTLTAQNSFWFVWLLVQPLWKEHYRAE